MTTGTIAYIVFRRIIPHKIYDIKKTIKSAVNIK